MILELKARAGVDYTFWWWAPTAISGSPTVTVRMSGGDVTPAVTAAHAAATVTADSTDRRTLTVNAIADYSGLAGDRGGYAVLVTQAHGPLPVKIRSITSATTVVLAEPLPFSPTVNNDSLQWTLWTATFTAAAVTGTALSRPVPFTVAWTASYGADMPTEALRQEGLLYVVRQPFHTGVDSHTLVELVPSLAPQLPRTQGSWEPQIRTAERVLIRRLRQDLSDDKREDDLNGAAFYEVHAYLAAARILLGQAASGADRTQAAEALEQKAWALYDQVMNSIPWLDLDGDGVVDAGETDYRAGLGTAGVASLFDGTDSDFDSDDFPVFSRLQDH